MTPKRPTGVTVVAILNIVLGAFGLLGGLCGLGGPAIQAAMKPQAGAGAKPDPSTLFQEEMERQDPNSKAVDLARAGISLLLGAGLLASGIGLLKLRPWGRTLAMTVAVIEILVVLASSGYDIAVTGPATQRAMENVKQQMAGRMKEPGIEPAVRMMEMMTGIAVWGVVGFRMLFLVYYVILLLVLNGAKAKAAFRRAAGEPDADDYDSYRGRDEPEDIDDRRRDS